jgi:hypothetical protein
LARPGIREQSVVRTILATIPIGLGIALNPIAIVAGLLILRTAGALRNGLAFLAGWIVGLALLVVLGSRLVALQGSVRRGGPTLPDIVWIAIGLALLASAVLRVARGRPLPGEEPPPPRWLGMVDRAGAGRSLGIGLFLATVSLRNLALLAAAASVFGSAGLGWAERALAIAAFVAVASLGILIPLGVRLFGGERADATLMRWGDGLNRNMGRITAGVMALVGLYLLGRGVLGLL